MRHFCRVICSFQKKWFRILNFVLSFEHVLLVGEDDNDEYGDDARDHEANGQGGEETGNQAEGFMYLQQKCSKQYW